MRNSWSWRTMHRDWSLWRGKKTRGEKMTRSVPDWRERRNCHTSVIQRGCKFSPRKDERALSKKQQLLFGNGWSMDSAVRVRCNCVSSSFPSLAESRFPFQLLSLFPSLRIFPQPANPLSRASSYLVPWKSLSPLLLSSSYWKLYLYLSLDSRWKDSSVDP